ncbi:ABC transporter permease [Roseibium aggregatum]|uniref:ABC transporter permease n=1 Tax=Roseibium aggregatum TaxID=187304 RepID=UPI003A974789
MIRFIFLKMGSIAIVMTLVALVVFLLVHLTPGDPATIIAGDNATNEQIDAIREAMGLDQPLPVQFVRWVAAILQGDLGVSIFSNVPVSQLILERIAPTISLALLTMSASVIIAVLAGMVSALKVGSWIDRMIMGLSIVGFSAPVFVVGYFLIYIFAIRLKWLPVQGYDPISAGFWPWLSHLTLPAMTLGFIYIALIARITRATMMDVLHEDYIRTARAKGVGTGRILLGHAFRNIGVPVVTVVGLGLALLIGGVVVTESVFNIPGVGRLVVDAISKRDYPIVQGVTLLFAAVYVVVNLLIDLSYGLIDPRIRHHDS